MHLSSEARDGLLEGWRTRLQGLLSEAPLTFPPIDSFDESKGFRLKPEVQEKQADSPFGLTVGHHLEKPLPPHSQMKAGVWAGATLSPCGHVTRLNLYKWINC